MKKGQLANFVYVKSNGDLSNRCVFVISPPSNKLFGLDLSEYSEEERVTIQEELNHMYKEMEARIDAMDLSSNYRQFLTEGIIEDG